MAYGYNVLDHSGNLLEPSFGTIRIIAREFFLCTDNTTRTVSNFDSDKGYYVIKPHYTLKERTGSTSYAFNRNFSSAFTVSTTYPQMIGNTNWLGAPNVSWNNSTKVLTVSPGSITINGSTDTPTTHGTYGGCDWADYEVSFWEFK